MRKRICANKGRKVAAVPEARAYVCESENTVRGAANAPPAIIPFGGGEAHPIELPHAGGREVPCIQVEAAIWGRQKASPPLPHSVHDRLVFMRARVQPPAAFPLVCTVHTASCMTVIAFPMR